MNKIITVVIPAYNIGRYIEQCLPGFLTDEILDDIEILIVNDGSKDDTAIKGAEFEARYPDTVKLVNKENGGHGSTINKGIQLAGGTYFKVVDGDDWVDPEAFKELVLFLKQSENVFDMIVNPYQCVYMDSGQKEIVDYKKYVDYGTYHFNEIAGKVTPIQMHAVTFRTDILKKNHIRIDENKFYVDAEYILFPIPYVKTVIFRPECVYQYRLATAGQSMNPKNLIKNRNMHKEVLYTLTKFYDVWSKQKIEDSVKQYIRRRVGYMVSFQISIYCMMGLGKNAQEELRKFEETLKKMNMEIYSAADGKKVWLLRASGYHLYSILSFFYRRKMHKEWKNE